MTILKQSSRSRSFQLTQLAQNVVICEAISKDYYSWKNATETEPAFLVYLGCPKEVSSELPWRAVVFMKHWVS
jgi:hypothetical protein